MKKLGVSALHTERLKISSGPDSKLSVRSVQVMTEKSGLKHSLPSCEVFGLHYGTILHLALLQGSPNPRQASVRPSARHFHLAHARAL